ncbi:hypothetical protein [Algoriphagus litoralis]|uniref:hypothetical protein n=1 Tax=Algoriphagus litoralis TaxID=2202829 RepID=UPI000DBA34F2|nr:hypothetical protein [Algoriphagus litoralis]
MKNPYFDITLIINLIIEQEPNRIDLIEQLGKSDWQKFLRRKYLYLIPDEGQIKESIVLEHEVEGTIVLDVLESGKIKGIEFVDQIF